MSVLTTEGLWGKAIVIQSALNGRQRDPVLYLSDQGGFIFELDSKLTFSAFQYKESLSIWFFTESITTSNRRGYSGTVEQLGLHL